MLKADVQTKLSVVNTGIRVLELSGMKGLDCEYRLCQEGLRTLVSRELITRQVVRAPVSDLLLLYQKRSAVRVDEFTPETARQLLHETKAGCFALVSEMYEAAGDAAGGPGSTPVRAHAPASAPPAGEKRRHLLVCSAMWSTRGAAEILVPKAESNAALIWLGSTGYRATSADQSNAASKERAAAAARA